MFGGRYFGGRYWGRRFWGKAGLVVDGAYKGARYWGPRYFGSRYFGSNDRSEPFELTQTQGIGLSGVVGVSAPSITTGSAFQIVQTQGIGLNGSLSVGTSLSYDSEVFYVTPPLAVGGLAGTVSIAASLVFGGPTPGYGSYWGRRYFGGRYFGPRYWGAPSAWPLNITQGIGLTGTVTAATSINTQVAIAPSTLGLTGTVGIAANLVFQDDAVEDFRPVGGKKKKRRVIYLESDRRYDAYHAWVKWTLVQLAAAGVFDA